MRKIYSTFIALLLLNLSSSLYAQSYYIANEGNDSNDGISEATPWKSLNRLNQAIKDRLFNPGDKILFKRGSTFIGTTLADKVKGEPGNPITYGAYGDASLINPTVLGYVPVTGWTSTTVNNISACAVDMVYLKEMVAPVNQHGNYEVDDIIAGKLQSVPKFLFLDDKMQIFARYPNDGSFMFIDDNSAKNSKIIKDTELASVPGLNQWAGAEAVIRTNNWTYDNFEIKSITSNSLTGDADITGGAGLALNNGYFLQGRLIGLDAPNEWFFDDTSYKLYFVPPNGMNCNQLDNRVKVSVFKTAFLLNRDVVLEDIRMAGFFGAAVPIMTDATHVAVNRCEAWNSKTVVTGARTGNLSITNNYFHDIFLTAISFWPTTETVITGNILNNIGLYPGVDGDYNGIKIGSNTPETSIKNVISYNKISNTGYAGIMFRVGDGNAANNSIIEKNVIEQSMRRLGDGGSIYLQDTSGLIIKDNILKNAYGNKDSWNQGKGDFGYTAYVFGVVMYGDKNHNISLIGNTIMNHDEGLHQDPGGKNLVMQGNTFYNNRVYQVKFVMPSDKSSGNMGYDIQNNIFYSAHPFQWTVRQNGNSAENWNFGTLAGNYYGNPYYNMRYANDYNDDTTRNTGVEVFRSITRPAFYGIYSADQWRNATNGDATAKTDIEKWPVLTTMDYKTPSEIPLYGSNTTLYEIDQVLSQNYVTNGTFESDSTPWEIRGGILTTEAKAGLSGKALKITSDGSAYSVQVNNGEHIPFEVGATYAMSLSVVRESDLPISVGPYLRKSISSSDSIGDKFIFPANAQKHSYTTLFRVTEAGADTRLYVYMAKEDPAVWIDDVAVYKVSVREAIPPTERSKIFINPTANPITIGFTGIDGYNDVNFVGNVAYKDLNGKVVKDNMVLQPFESKILIYTDENPHGIPKLSLQQNGTQITASWQPIDNAKGYRLYYANYPNAETGIMSLDLGNINTLTVDLKGAAKGSGYYVAIKAYNDVSYSYFSNIEHFVIN